ncbi:MAG TPA: acyl-CoA dehydrogenase family protein, partial [Dehalococcoidia bacterium]|nr:acyl-CoA dehydrogenase family protein [Dehalococcoidia bacterium]
MQFRFTPEQESFRKEIRAFLREAGEAASIEAQGGRWERYRAFQKRMAERGWLTLAWPKEYGGQAADYMTQLVFNEEMSYHGAPNPGIGVDRVGPTMMIYGTEEQKAFHLPRIAAGEVIWCQGFTEPQAGSDLASLQTRAVLDGDSFVINGQKMFTSLAHAADYCALLARTDPEAPKHRGISYFLLDMRTPGITVRPLLDAMGNHTFNEVFLEDVRVPRSSVLGEVNRGWYLASTTLDFERSGIHRVMGSFRQFEMLVDFCRAEHGDASALIQRPSVRHRLADLKIA